LLLTMACLVSVRQHGRARCAPHLPWSVTLFAVVTSIAALSALARDVAVPVVDRDWGASRLLFFLLAVLPAAYLASHLIRAERDVVVYCWAQTLLGAGCAVTVLVAGRWAAGPRYGLMGDQCALAVVSSLALALTGRHWWLAPVGLLGMAGVGQSAARGALVDACVATVVLFVFSLRRAWPRLVLFRLVSVGLLAISAGVPAWQLYQHSGVFATMRSRFAAVARGESEGDRRRLMTAAVTMFAEQPLVGHGLGAFRERTGYGYPHNMFVDTLVQSGVLGGLALLGIGCQVVAAAAGLVRKQGDVWVASAFLALWLSHSMFSGDFAGQDGLWAWTAIAIGLASGLRCRPAPA